MAGHSHWANIKRTKGAADAKRGKVFSKLAREISVAASIGGGDVNYNIRLRTAINAAKAESMPADTIDRAVKKGTGELEGSAVEEMTYEGYAPAGVAVLVEAMTDNKNRTAAEIRSIFSKGGGNLAGSGSVAWMFKKKAIFLLKNTTEEAVLEATIEHTVDEILTTDEGVELVCPLEQFSAVDTSLKASGVHVESSQLVYLPDNTQQVSEPETTQSVLRLLEQLEDHDDVQKVYSNLASD